MENVLDLLQNISKKYQNELDEIKLKIAPLEKKKNEIEAKLLKYNDLISLELGDDINCTNHKIDNSQSITEIMGGDKLPISGTANKKTTPVESYKRIITEKFHDKTFRESDIRLIANHEGVTTREGAEISPSYSRSIFVYLKKNNFVKQVERGVYQYQRQQAL